MKTCKRCGTEKPLEDFALAKGYKDGRRSTCKRCMNLLQRKRGWVGPTARLPREISRSIGL